jgi:hypothetical protein
MASPLSIYTFFVKACAKNEVPVFMFLKIKDFGRDFFDATLSGIVSLVSLYRTVYSASSGENTLQPDLLLIDGINSFNIRQKSFLFPDRTIPFLRIASLRSVIFSGGEDIDAVFKTFKFIFLTE